MTTTYIRPCALQHDRTQCDYACNPAGLSPYWTGIALDVVADGTHVWTEDELTHPPAPVERPQIGVVGFVILGHVGPVRSTFLSRFWTIPAHQNPIARRMSAL